MKFLIVVLVGLFSAQGFAQVDCDKSIAEVAELLRKSDLVLGRVYYFTKEINKDLNVHSYACAMVSSQKAIEMIDMYVDISNQVVSQLSVNCAGFSEYSAIVTSQINQIASERSDIFSGNEHIKEASLRLDPTGLDTCSKY